MSTKNKALLLLAAVAVIGIALVAVRPKSTTQGIQAGFDAEFLTRPDGYKGLSEHYGFRFDAEPIQMDPGLMYRAAADGAVDVICGFATEGRIPAYDLFVLEDDKGFFHPDTLPPACGRGAAILSSSVRSPKTQRVEIQCTGITSIWLDGSQGLFPGKPFMLGEGNHRLTLQAMYSLHGNDIPFFRLVSPGTRQRLTDIAYGLPIIAAQTKPIAVRKCAPSGMKDRD